jgi:hypothetical protein
MYKLSCGKAYYIDWVNYMYCVPCGGNLCGRTVLCKMPSESGSKEWKVYSLCCRKIYNGTRTNLYSMCGG